MKIALVQMDVAHGQPTENKKHVKEMLERALGENPDVIVLPEMWNTGYALDELDGLADKEGLNSQELLSHFCLLYTSPSPRDAYQSRMPSSA